jgi:outer membrane protein TolC
MPTNTTANQTKALMLPLWAAFCLATPVDSSAEDWKFSESPAEESAVLKQKLKRQFADVEMTDNLEKIYQSDSEPVNWRNKDKDINPEIIDWERDEDLQRLSPIVGDAEKNVELIGTGGNPYASDISDGQMPDKLNVWWDREVLSQMGRNTVPNRETPESLILRAMEHSSQIKVFSDVPIIRETAELEAVGEFDPIAYSEYRLTDLDEPVGSTLKTGGPERFFEDEWLFRAGIRKKFVTGTEIDLSQRWGVLDNNSEFLEPKDQGNAKIAITLTQPLINGLGIRYNRSLIDVAQLDGSIARDEFKRQVESHLLELVRSYWGLYLERATLTQRRALVRRTQKIADTLEARSGYDVSEVQAQRVRSEVLVRKSDVVRAESAVRNAEARIVSLINDPEFSMRDTFELLPETTPITAASTVTHDMALALALANRPEIDQAFKQARASAIRVNMTRNELRPVLNFVLGYARDGLAGEGDYNQAFDNQFDLGDGSWIAGLVFEMPLGNRVAKSRLERRQAEARQLAYQLKTTVDTVLLEVQVSVREIHTSYREMHAKYTAMQALIAEVDSLEQRQGVELVDGNSGGRYLERLLDAQDRLTESEHELLRSMTTYNVALVNLDRATGMFMQTNDIRPRYFDDKDPYIDGLPAYGLEKVSSSQ